MFLGELHNFIYLLHLYLSCISHKYWDKAPMEPQKVTLYHQVSITPQKCLGNSNIPAIIACFLNVQKYYLRKQVIANLASNELIVK